MKYERELIVDLRLLEYATSTGIFTGGVVEKEL